MAELTKKLNVKKSGAAAEEIKLYSTLDEVNNQGVSLKSDGINCYAAYGDASDSKASNLNYKPSGSSESYKVLKEAPSTSSGDGVTITLKARRNNEDFMQDLPSVVLQPGQKFYINNSNAPTIEGYDFVCCSINNFVPTENQEINVYYIPQTIPDRTKTDWSRSFYSDSDLTGDLSSQDYANTYAATNMEALFSKSTISAPPKLNMFNVTNVSYMFYQCESLVALGASNFNTSKVTNMEKMFAYCTALASLNVDNWDTNNIVNMTEMFYSCNNLTALNLSSFNTSKVTNMANLFYGCKKLTALDVSNWDTGNVTDMYQMFCRCYKLTSLDLSSFNTNKVTDMSEMFSGGQDNYAVNLTSLDISSFNTSNVINMTNMFNGCKELTALDVSKFNTSKVTNMRGMFYLCEKLTTLDTSNWDTSNVTDMASMFKSCSSLTTLDTSNWDTSKVTNMVFMFSGCKFKSVTGVIDMSSCTSCANMFWAAHPLQGVHLKNVPRSLNISNIGGTEGETYIIDNYLD